MTEEEARTKWCPFARAERAADEPGWPAVNRLADNGERRLGRAGAARGAPDPWCQCLASGCMAWRTRTNDDFNKRALDAFDRTGVELRPAGPEDLFGYCGLAGEPPFL